MNTRLQIEHPVTELITGLDLVEWQFRVAAGEALPLAQDAITAKGAAVEARLYAEDPATGFLPSPGKIWCARFPHGEGVRVDCGIETGSEVPPFYDAMIAKIIGYGADRTAAYDRLLSALQETIVAGPQTNLAFLHALAAQAKAKGAQLSTRYIEANLSELTASKAEAGIAGQAALALLHMRQEEAARLRRAASSEPHSPWDINDAFDFLPPRTMTYDIEAGGERETVAIAWTADGPRLVDGSASGEAEAIPAEDGVILWRSMRQHRIRFAPRQKELAGSASSGVLRAPMPGRLTKLFVRESDGVELGDRLAIVEAMKMEHVLHAPATGSVKRIFHREGHQVDLGAIILELETDGGHASD